MYDFDTTVTDIIGTQSLKPTCGLYLPPYDDGEGVFIDNQQNIISCALGKQVFFLSFFCQTNKQTKKMISN
jgi:hypothetical protein